MEFWLGREANADFNKASDFLYITNKASFKNSSSLENIVFFRQSSKDYWITRGNPIYWYVKKPENYGTEIKFSGPSGDFFNYYLVLSWLNGLVLIHFESLRLFKNHLIYSSYDLCLILYRNYHLFSENLYHLKLKFRKRYWWKYHNRFFAM